MLVAKTEEERDAVKLEMAAERGRLEATSITAGTGDADALFDAPWTCSHRVGGLWRVGQGLALAAPRAEAAPGATCTALVPLLVSG